MNTFASVAKNRAIHLQQELVMILRETDSVDGAKLFWHRVDFRKAFGRKLACYGFAKRERQLLTKTLAETTRKALIKARVGHGLFRQNLTRFEDHCRITGVRYQSHLFASHIKPWRESSNEGD